MSTVTSSMYGRQPVHGVATHSIRGNLGITMLGAKCPTII